MEGPEADASRSNIKDDLRNFIWRSVDFELGDIDDPADKVRDSVEVYGILSLGCNSLVRHQPNSP